MKLLALRPLLILAFTGLSISSFLSGCSVYENQGRKSFESDSNGRTVSLSSHEKNEPDTCWTQNMNEALWQVTDDSNLIVKKISDKKIEVCMEPQPTNEE